MQHASLQGNYQPCTEQGAIMNIAPRIAIIALVITSSVCMGEENSQQHRELQLAALSLTNAVKSDRMPLQLLSWLVMVNWHDLPCRS